MGERYAGYGHHLRCFIMSAVGDWLAPTLVKLWAFTETYWVPVAIIASSAGLAAYAPTSRRMS